MTLSEWIKARRAQRIKTAEERGYAWAAATILRSEGETDKVQAHIDCARDMGTYSDFDSGAEEALRVWRRLFRSFMRSVVK